MSGNGSLVIKFTLGNQFTLDLSHKGTVLNNPDVKRWLDNAKTDIEWNYWNAFNEFLQNDEGRPIKVIESLNKFNNAVLTILTIIATSLVKRAINPPV